ncbi:HNH endonuclease [Demequina sp. TTPB684]|uniref:HNH endonuclease signature motif containing protein n=1 Tax=unclassified Demequina TaxID=2620311 RepID=UPI001CF50051|nr:MULTISPECIES: HNH endonuclease signature motif containing protein [unclassified Demequina]MCB2412362.1 HNH endonuclease [Demequina sp. TTPB684]UPU89032.1 HNH endonuclease [Demequina sp. TMPB413]
MAATRTGTTVHKRMRKRTLARDRAAGITHCPIPGCGAELDYDTTDRSNPAKAEADEITPWSHTQETSTDLEDWRTICAHCNQSRGSNAQAPVEENANLFPPSRAW